MVEMLLHVIDATSPNRIPYAKVMRAANTNRSHAQWCLDLPRFSRSSAVAHVLFGALIFVCLSIALTYSQYSSVMVGDSNCSFSKNLIAESSPRAADPPLFRCAIWHSLTWIASCSVLWVGCPCNMFLILDK